MEEKALKDLHPLYREWCEDDEREPRDEDAIAEQYREFYEGR